MFSLTPNETYRNISDISLEYLINEVKIKGLIFDFDGTLFFKNEINDKTVDFLKRAKDSGLKVSVVSNNFNVSDSILKDINVPTVKRLAFKPLKKPLLDMAKRMKLEPHKIAVIGNNKLTDIFGANRAGMFSIYIQNNINNFFTKKNNEINLEEKGINHIDD